MRSPHPGSRAVRGLPSSPPAAPPDEQDDALRTAGRALLYPGLALTSVLVLRGPAELPIGDLLIAAAGLLGALSLARRGQRLPGALVLAGGLVAVGVLVASAVSSDPADSLGIGARLLYLVLVVPWILLALLVEDRHVVRAVLWLLAGAAVCAAAAVVQVLVGDVLPGVATTSDNRLTGFTANASDLGGIAAMGVGGALGAVVSPLARRHRIAAAAVLAVSTAGLVLSGSVSGMLAVVAVVLFLIVRGAVSPRRAVVLGVACAVAGGFALYLVDGVGGRSPLERLIYTTSDAGGANTAGSRLEMADRAVAGIAESPLTGHGLAIADNVVLRTFTVHNNFLAAWHSGGILLLAGVVIASAIAIRYCLMRERSDPLHTTVTSAVVVAVAFAQTAPSVYNRYYWLPVALVVVLAVRRPAGRPGQA